MLPMCCKMYEPTIQASLPLLLVATAFYIVALNLRYCNPKQFGIVKQSIDIYHCVQLVFLLQILWPSLFEQNGVNIGKRN